MNRHIYRELAKIKRAEYDRGSITWDEFKRYYRIYALNNARLYRKEVERHDAGSRAEVVRNARIVAI